MGDHPHEVVPRGQVGVAASPLDQQPFVRLLTLEPEKVRQRPCPLLTLARQRFVSRESIPLDNGILFRTFLPERLAPGDVLLQRFVRPLPRLLLHFVGTFAFLLDDGIRILVHERVLPAKLVVRLLALDVKTLVRFIAFRNAGFCRLRACSAKVQVGGRRLARGPR